MTFSIKNKTYEYRFSHLFPVLREQGLEERVELQEWGWSDVVVQAVALTNLQLR